MKRSLIAITAALLAASGASAATLTLDLDKSSYGIGEDIILTATLVTDGTEILQPFEAILLEVGWDSSVASVANAGVSYPDGNGTQLVTAGVGVGGSVLTYNLGTPISSPNPTPPCSAFGPSCQFLSQIQSDLFAPVTLDAQTLVATLVLQANAVGLLGESIENYVNTTPIQLGPNWGNAVVVPEPTTGALLALGLLGLAGARRR